MLLIVNIETIRTARIKSSLETVKKMFAMHYRLNGILKLLHDDQGVSRTEQVESRNNMLGPRGTIAKNTVRTTKE